MFKITTIAVWLICVALVRSRPRKHNNPLEAHFERIVRTSCNQEHSSEALIKKDCHKALRNIPRLSSFKKNVYSLLESKLQNLNKSQQLVVANALIHKLYQLRRTVKYSHVPRQNNEDMFARML